MLSKFMAIPHHTYLIMKMPAPKGILFVLGDIMVSYNYESSTVELSKDSACKSRSTLEVLEQKHTTTTLNPSPSMKKVCLVLSDASKEVTIGADLDPK
jgi:hypothetical protein